MESRSKLIVLFAFCLASGILAYFLAESVVRTHKPVSVPVSDNPSEPEPAWPEPTPEEVKNPSTSYDFGYERGWRAFMEQQGQPVPKAATYTSLSEGELDEEAAGKGYVDGYHKAGGSLYCPRCER